MKRRFFLLRWIGLRGVLVLALWAAATLGAGAAVVSNGRASQRSDGSGLVDVYYDLSGASGKTWVNVVFSSDGGVSYTVLPSMMSLSGDVGTVTSSGANKHLVWNAGADKPGVRFPQMRAKISAGEGGQTSVIYLPGGVPLELVLVPAGSFVMGANENDQGWSDSDEYPAHTVNLAYSFYMCKYEVTQGQWLAVMGSWPHDTPSSTYGVGDNYPAYNVSWSDIAAAGGFLEKLNLHIVATGQGPATFRLPSEAEWEYACRAGSTTRFCFGNSNCAMDGCPSCDLADYAWFCGNNSLYGSRPVGGKLPNAFGLSDMHGNVLEWCQDWYHSSYAGVHCDGSAWDTPQSGYAYRVLRGGYWYHAPRGCRSAGRGYHPPDSVSINLGFRFARTQE